MLFNGSVAPAGAINVSLADWSEATATWNNFGGDAGVDPTEFGASLGAAPLAAGTANINVTASLQSWSGSPASNFGWIFRPNSTDGVQVRSAEYATTPSERPRLSVTYLAPTGGCTTNADCSDAQFCNGVEQCVAGSCQPGAPVNCADAIACTADSCDEANDVCVHTPVPASCDDGNLCTSDACVPATGCVFSNNSNPCDDANACTSGDVCGGGTCTGSPVFCDDGVACTADTCDTGTGCVNTSTCTGGQTCNLTNGLCESAPVVISFQDGSGGYTGTVDAYLHAGLPTADNSLVTTLIVDGPTVAAPGDKHKSCCDSIICSPRRAVRSRTGPRSPRPR